MSKDKTHVIIQDIEFNIAGLKGFKKDDFIKCYKAKSEAAKGKGKWGRFDAVKAWDELKAK